ncbi:MAG: HlyC/CorC family transporter [Deltaproteobacteria bacterium]|nr:HlyC/CorC family transporter [Deltaproteobacteria bacterium]
MDGSGNPFPLVETIGIVACLIASAFFSGSETALTRITTSRAATLMATEPGKYGILKLWVDSRKRILAGLLVGNNLVNILCSILAYRVAIRFLPNYAEAISVFGLTLVILVFAEVTPKSVALQKAERIAVPILRVVWLVDKLLFPLSFPLSRIPGWILGQAGDELDEPVTEDEIEFQIRRGVDQSVFEEQGQGELLMSAVEFADIMVKEVMIPRTDIFGLERDTPLGQAVHKIIEQGHSRVPVYDDNLDQIVGLIYAKDLLRFIQRRGSDPSEPIASMVRGAPMFVPETQKIQTLLGDMRRKGLHMAMVVDEFGGTSGLVTLEDVIEELVGEIRDEFDPEEAMIRALGDSRWLVDARLSLNDFKDETGIGLPDTGDYESVGGYVVAKHGRIPRKGRVIEAPGVELVVLESDARHVKRLEARSIKTLEEDDPEHE